MDNSQMVYDPSTGTWVPMGSSPPVQPLPVNGNVQPYAPAPTMPVQPAAPQVPHYQQYAQAAPPANIFADPNASTALALLQGDDEESSSMDDIGGESVPTIRMNDMGWIVKRIDGIDLPPQPSIDVVIIGVGPKGGGVYRTFFGQNYNPNEKTKPICVSFDGKTPSRSSTQMQCATCEGCPQNIDGSGQNGKKACKFSAHFAVVDVTDPTRVYRLRLSATPLFARALDPQGYHTVPTYKTFLQSHGSNWEQVITRVSCPYGKNGGFRFNATGFITPELRNQIKELKQMINLNLVVDLNAVQQTEQLQLAVNGQPVAQIPVTQLPSAPTAVVAPQPVAPQPVAPAPAPVAPAPAPVVPAPAPVAPAPVSLKDQWLSHPSLTPEVKAWIANPQVTEQMAHDYLATNFPAVLTPVAPAPVQPQPVAPAPVQPQPVAQPVAQTLPATPPVEPQPAPQPVAAPQPMAAPQTTQPTQGSNNAIVDGVIADLLGGDDLSAIK